MNWHNELPVTPHQLVLPLSFGKMPTCLCWSVFRSGTARVEPSEPLCGGQSGTRHRLLRCAHIYVPGHEHRSGQIYVIYRGRQHMNIITGIILLLIYRHSFTKTASFCLTLTFPFCVHCFFCAFSFLFFCLLIFTLPFMLLLYPLLSFSPPSSLLIFRS